MAGIAVDASVWSYWEDQRRQFKAPSLVLLFRTAMTPGDARAMVVAAAGEAVTRLAAAHPVKDGVDDFVVGVPIVVISNDGVLLQIDEGPDDLPTLLAEICAGLTERGAAGRFELSTPSGPVGQLPGRMRLVQAHLRAVGERYDIKDLGIRYDWRPDGAALQRLLHAGASWCLELREGSELSFSASTARRALVRAEDVPDRVAECHAAATFALLAVQRDGRARLMSFDAGSGRVALIEGGDFLTERTWRPTLTRLRQLIIDNATDLVYGFLKPGLHVSVAVHGTALKYDWPLRPGFEPGHPSAGAYENEFALDAFPVQILTAAHLGKADGELPLGPDWRMIPLTDERFLLEQIDPGPWFTADFFDAPIYGAASGRPIAQSPAGRAARATLAPMLISDSVIKRPDRGLR